MPSKKRSSQQWSAKTKLAVVNETAGLSSTKLSQYCRDKYLYYHHINELRTACLQGFTTTQEQQQNSADRQEIKILTKELRKKEKALAEVTALLVLRKKLKAFYREEDKEE